MSKRQNEGRDEKSELLAREKVLEGVLAITLYLEGCLRWGYTSTEKVGFLSYDTWLFGVANQYLSRDQ